MTGAPRLLQVCHDLTGAHRELAHCHAAAAAVLGFSVETLVLRGAPDAAVAADIGGAGVYFADLPTTAFKGQRWRLRRAVRRVCADLPYAAAIAHRWKPLQAVAGLPPRLRPARVLGVAHELGLFRRRGRRLWQRMRAPDMQVAGVSEAVRADLVASHPGLPAPGVVPNVLDVARARARLLHPAAARRQLGLPQDAVLLGQVGRLHYKKRPALALEAFAGLASGHPELHLVFLGDGEERGALEAQAAGLGLTDRVHITGWQPAAAPLLPALDLLLLTSTPAEAFGLVLLEAMVAGVPVVTTDSPGPAAVVADAGVVCTADPQDLVRALEPLLGAGGAERRAELATAGRVRVSRAFDVPALATALAPLLGVGRPDQ